MLHSFLAAPPEPASGVTINPLMAPSTRRELDAEPAEMACGLRAHALVGADARAVTDSLARLAGIDPPKSRGGGAAAATGATCKFPGPNPVSIDSGHFPQLKAQPYMITEKTDGMRALLYFLRYDDANLVVTYDRTMSRPYVFAPLERVPNSLYQGTLIDGELVQINGEWTFLIFDAVYVAGAAVFHLPFPERLAAIRAPLAAWYSPAPGDLATLAIKHFMPFRGTDSAEAFATYAKTVPCRTDGAILMPVNDQVVYGRHDRLFKLKTHHTVDFLTRNKKLLIYDEKSKRNVVVCAPAGPKAHLATTDGVVLECDFDGKAWCPIHVRTDKTSANTKFTLEKTLLNIREKLSLDTVARAL